MYCPGEPLATRVFRSHATFKLSQNQISIRIQGERSHRKTRVLRSVGCELGPVLFLGSISAGSTLRGTRPNLDAKTSSTMTELLFQTYTSSIAIVGTYLNGSRHLPNPSVDRTIRTSAIKILRNAFAMEASTPMRSNSIDLCERRCTRTRRFFQVFFAE